MAINKEYNDIQLDVKFTQASSRANIVSEENISVSFGKLAKWYEALVPTGGSSGKILAWNSSGTAKWSDPLHPTITKSADTTSTPAQLSHGGTFTAITSVTREGNGHVTKINTATYTLPNDTSMTQTNTTGSADYRVLLSGNANDTTETTTGRKSTNLKFNPSSGGLYSFGFLWTDITGQTLDINTLTLSNGTLHSRRFIEKTDGGAANITNIPVTGKPFLLEVDLIRWGSTTDYITRQRFTNAANGTYSYVRYCTNGTWGSWTTRKYTDTDTKVTSSANHYTPATASGQDKTASASGATAAWSIDVVKGVTLNTDGKGHVTGLSVISGKIPANPVPSNNVTGSGTSGYLVKWNGTNTITNGPQLGSSTTTYLRNDGSWATPPNTTYSAGDHLSLSSTTFSIASYCKSITDWNSATTNGWYMGSSVTNAPSTAWWFGRVVAYNNKYCMQEVWQFTASTDGHKVPHKMRMFVNNVWGNWVDVTVGTQVPENAVFTDHITTVTSSGSGNAVTDISADANGALMVTKGSTFSLSTHTHGLLNSSFAQVASDASKTGWSILDISPAGFILKSIRDDTTNTNWLSGDHSAGIAFGGADTRGVISMKWHLPVITFAGGNHNSTNTGPDWYIKISGTSGSTYNLANFYDSTISRTANTVLAAPNGSNGGATFRKLVAADLPSHTHSYLPLSGTTINNPNTSSVSFTNGMTGNILFANTGNTNGVARGIGGIVGTTDSWSVRGYQTGENKGCLEISVGDDGDEGIYVRQYTSGAYKATFSNNAGSASGLTYRELVLMAPNTGASTFPSDVTLSGGKLYLSGGAGSYGQLNLKTASYNVMFRNDNTNTYILLTAKDDPNGSWTSARPLTIVNSTGVCSINGNAATSSSWATARTLTIGSTGKSVDGSGNVSWTLSEIGAASSSHTHDYAGSSSAGGAANSANVLNKNTRMDYGWDGVNYFNINGTAGNAAKVNDTPTTAWWHIMRFNNYNSSGYYTDLAIPFGTTSLYYKRITGGLVQNGGWVKVLDSLNYTSYTYNATTSRTANTVLAAPNGSNGGATFRKLVAADLPSHTHNYAGSSSAGGPALSAAKLETARNIALAEDLAGSANFDGSGNISISGTFYRCSASSNNTANYPWHRIAYRTGVTGVYNDTDAIFMIRAYYHGGPFGIIKVTMRTNGSGANCQVAARWLVRQNIAANDVYIAQWGKTGQSVYADIFLRGTTYNRAYVYQIAGSRSWTLVNSGEASDTTTSDKKTSTEVYASIAAAGTTLHNQAYTQTVAGIDEGHVNSANSAIYATRANYINVVAGNEIRFYNDNQLKANNHFWLGYSWADGSHYTPSGGSDTSSTTAPNITKFIMGNCSQGGLASVHAKTFILGNGSSPTHTSKTTTIATAATTTDRTITLPNASGNVILGTKGSTSYWGLMDGAGSISEWIRATSSGFIPSQAAKFFQTATSSLGTDTWYFKNSYIQYMNANRLILGAAKTADGAAKGQLKFFSGNASDATGTVTLECVNDAARTGDYTVKLPTWNGTIPVFEKLFDGALSTVSLSYSDINEYDLFLITVANNNGTSEQVTVASLWISNVAGIHDMPLIWGGAPTSSGGSCNVTSGWIQLSKNSGTTTFSVAHKSNVAQMTSSGWSISSPTYNLYIRKIFGLKAYKRT